MSQEKVYLNETMQKLRRLQQNSPHLFHALVQIVKGLKNGETNHVITADVLASLIEGGWIAPNGELDYKVYEVLFTTVVYDEDGDISLDPKKLRNLKTHPYHGGVEPPITH